MLAEIGSQTRAHALLLGVSEGSPLLRWLRVDLNCSFELCDSPADLIATAAGVPPNFILVGEGLPAAEMPGLFRTLRGAAATEPLPIALLLAGSARKERYVPALDHGADDLITFDRTDEPPFRLRELVRRSRPSEDDQILVYADLKVDLRRRRAFRGTRALDLTSKPFRLLCLLVSQPYTAFSHQALMDALWVGGTADERAVRACVMRLRHALTSGGEPDLIRTVRGSGYTLAAPDSAPQELLPDRLANRESGVTNPPRKLHQSFTSRF